jgi:ABC-type sugar transport system substrate-binding protein
VSPGEPAELAEALAATLQLSPEARERQVAAAQSVIASGYDIAVNGPAVAASIAALCAAAAA